MTPALKVVSGGLNTTVQDFGRTGNQKLGIAVAGALDWISYRLANLLVGNPAGAAALEISYLGPTLEVAADWVRVALVGTKAEMEIAGAGRRIKPGESVRLERGSRFRVGGFSDTTVAYIAIEGGIDVPAPLGSRATLARASLGGLDGRALADGDMLPLALASAPRREERRLPPLPSHTGPFRVVLGPQDDHFTAEQIATFLGSTYTVARASDRMGARLEGPAFPHAISIVSDAIAQGAIQVPGNGLPIVLLADRQTTGGYPKIATVASADLPYLGRLGAGSSIKFEKVSVAEAEDLRRKLEEQVISLAGAIEPIAATGEVDESQLRSDNLVSGVFDASADPHDAASHGGERRRT